MQPPEHIGLCATCRHARVIAGARSTFYLCGRSSVDPRFPRYPPLPVLRCAGYEASVGSPTDADPPESPSEPD
jgi:hypothetical protein